MKLKSIGSNMTELNYNNNSILFSYETPVAGFDNKGAFRTSEHYSPTTSKAASTTLHQGGKVYIPPYRGETWLT